MALKMRPKLPRRDFQRVLLVDGGKTVSIYTELETVQLPTDDDSLQLFKETLPCPDRRQFLRIATRQFDIQCESVRADSLQISRSLEGSKEEVAQLPARCNEF